MSSATTRMMRSFDNLSCSLVHDICRPREKKTGKSHFWDEALAIISNVLDEVSGLSDEYKEHILYVVALHDMYDREYQIQKTIELQIVQDADNLDAIGALGIWRTFTFGGAYGLPMYDPDISYIHKEFFEEVPGQHTPTTVDHFYEKLLKLSQYMNTSTGKQMAHGRHVYMEQFLDQFFAERNWEK